MKHKTIRITDFVFFAIIGGYFSWFSIETIGAFSRHFLENFVGALTLLGTAFMLFLYLKSYNRILKNKFFIASFISKIFSVSFPIITIVIILIIFVIFGPVGMVGAFALLYSIYIAWGIYIISIILFAIGYFRP